MELTKKQTEAVRKKSEVVWFRGERASGRSMAGIAFLLDNLRNSKNAMFVSSSLDMLNYMIGKVAKALEESNIKYKVNSHEKTFYLIDLDCEIRMRSADNPDYMRGMENQVVILDDADYFGNSNVFDIAYRTCMRDPNKKILFTTENRNYDAVEDWVLNHGRCSVVRVRMEDNPHLPLSYVETVRNAYAQKGGND